MKDVMIIDAHMHLGSPGPLFTCGWELDDILRLMDKLGIERGYSMHNFWLAGRISEARAESEKAYEKSGGRLPFLAIHDPRQEKKSLRAIDACLKHEGFLGIKIHPSFHGLYADDERYDIIWNYAREHKLPILSHTWSVTDNPVQKLSEPVRFEKYISRYPEVTFIAGHCGGPGSGREQVIRLAQKHPSVCLDVSGDIFSLNLISELVGSVGADRVIFGTDQPWIDPRAHLMRIFLADIKEEEKRLVLGQNALRIYEPRRLSKECRC